MKALVIVDVQYDFMPGGALPVAQGDLLAGPIIEIRDTFDYVVFTQDWHPADHCSFTENGGIWPRHCVQNSDGAQIDRRIIRPGDIVIQKGIHRDVDSYSGFWDNARKFATRLDRFLRERQVTDVYLCGLATDYCVKFTALDAYEAGYNVTLVADVCRGVEANAGDVDRAMKEMVGNGIAIIGYQTIR